MKMLDANRQIEKWRHDAKMIHKYSDVELAKKIGCSVSTLTHQDRFYRMPFYHAMKLKELAEG